MSAIHGHGDLPTAPPTPGAVNPNAAMPAPIVAPYSRTGVPRPSMQWYPANTIQQRSGAPIDTIVMHHTNSTGPASDIGRFFADPATKVSAHYIVGKDGTIIQCVPDPAMARHAGVSEFQGKENVNDYSLGIEIVNDGDGKDPYTDAQYRALGQLMGYLMTEHGVSWARVTGHKDIARPVGRKDDPSANFSYARLRQEVERIAGVIPAQAAPRAAAPQPTAQPQAQAQPTYRLLRPDAFIRSGPSAVPPMPPPMPGAPPIPGLPTPAPFDPRYQ